VFAVTIVVTIIVVTIVAVCFPLCCVAVVTRLCFERSRKLIVEWKVSQKQKETKGRPKHARPCIQPENYCETCHAESVGLRERKKTGTQEWPWGQSGVTGSNPVTFWRKCFRCSL
jgi:hypothetical protein